MFENIVKNVERIFENYGFKPIIIGDKINYTYGENRHYYRVNTWGKRIVIESARSLEEAKVGVYEDAEVIDIPRELEGESDVFTAKSFYNTIEALIELYFTENPYKFYLPGNDEAARYLRKAKGYAHHAAFYDGEKYYCIEHFEDVDRIANNVKQEGYCVDPDEFIVSSCNNADIKLAVFRAYKSSALSRFVVNTYDLESIKQGQKLDTSAIIRNHFVTKANCIISMSDKLFAVSVKEYNYNVENVSFSYDDHDDAALVNEIQNTLDNAEFFGELNNYNSLVITELTMI